MVPKTDGVHIYSIAPAQLGAIFRGLVHVWLCQAQNIVRWHGSWGHFQRQSSLSKRASRQSRHSLCITVSWDAFLTLQLAACWWSSGLGPSSVCETCSIKIVTWTLDHVSDSWLYHCLGEHGKVTYLFWTLVSSCVKYQQLLLFSLGRL